MTSVTCGVSIWRSGNYDEWMCRNCLRPIKASTEKRRKQADHRRDARVAVKAVVFDLV